MRAPRKSFKAAPINARGYPESRFTLQVYVEDCTGCGVCVENCPAHSPTDPAVKAINMKDRLQHLEAGRESIRFFETLPWADRTRVNFANVRGVQFLEPLFEFSGACAGCGETPYLKLMSQLFGDRLQIANATGLLVDLRRQPADHPVGRERRRPRTGVGQLALRGQRRVRSRLSPRDRQPDRAGAGPRAEARAAHRRGSRVGHPAGAAGDRVGLPRAAAARGGAEDGARRSDGPRCGQPARARRLPRPSIGVDRRRRRLGVRHRLRRPRPRARVGQGRQHHRARHRGLFEHRRTGVEGHAARRDRRSSPRQARRSRARTWR